MRKMIKLVMAMMILAVMVQVPILSLTGGVASAITFIDEDVYMLSNSPFRYDELTYNMNTYYDADGEGYIDFISFSAGWALNGTTNIDCGLYVSDTDMSMQVWYEHGYKSSLEDYLDELSGEIGFGNWTCNTYQESLFVPDEGVYVYQGDPEGWDVYTGDGGVDPPTLDLYVGLPETGHRAVFSMTGDVEEEYLPDTYMYMWSFVTSSEGEAGCEGWDDIWEFGQLQPTLPYAGVASTQDEESSSIVRMMNGFDTEVLPDSAEITSATWRLIPYLYSTNTSDYQFTAVGVNNGSFSPMLLNMTEWDWPWGYFNESEFDDVEFASFNTSELPFPPMEYEGFNMNASVYVDLEMNEDGIAYVNKTASTVYALREDREIDRTCPEEGGIMTMYWTEGFFGYPYPIGFLIVDYLSDGEPTPTPTPTPTIAPAPIIDNPPVAAMTVIMGLVFTIIGLLGMMTVLFHGEGLIGWVRVGLLTGMTIFMIIGVVILQSIIVAVT